MDSDIMLYVSASNENWFCFKSVSRISLSFAGALQAGSSLQNKASNTKACYSKMITTVSDGVSLSSVLPCRFNQTLQCSL